jgi:serine protease Do
MKGTICLLLLNFVLFSAHDIYAKTSVETEELASIQKTSKAFTSIAKRVMPAVVYINVEKTIETGQSVSPFEFNNPFDLFNDDFFNRFFGYRYPQMEPRKYKQMGMGSGFIISEDGYILTNHHVVGDADKITVRLKDGQEYEAEIIGSDSSSDVALVKIKGSKNLPILTLGDSDSLEVGEWVMAIGNPFGLDHTLTVGVVSAKGRTTVGISDYEDFIQTDAAINPGNSGGPLINLKGEVIGINSAIFSRSGGYMGIGFAIPINMVKAIQEQLIDHGEVKRGYLGVYLQDLTKKLMESFQLENTEGVLVSDVTEGSPAEKAGFKHGDVIVEYMGKKVINSGQLRNMVGLTSPGTKVKIALVRDGKRKVLVAKLDNLEEANVSGVSQTDIMEKLGFSVQDLTEELARQFGYQDTKGVIVSQVDPGTPAQFAGLKRGALILEVNRKEVRNVQDFLKALEGSKNVLLLVREGQYTRYVILQMD